MNNYQIEKHKIKTGSLVFLKAQKLKHKVVTWVTGGLYSHCGLAFWVSDFYGYKRLLLVEAHYGGCRIINLSSYSDRSMLILDIGLNFESIGDFIIDKTGKVPYGFIDFILVGIKDILIRTYIFRGLIHYIPNTYGEICSEFLANALKEADYHIEDTLCSPEYLLRMIESKKLVKERFEIS